MTTFKLRGLAEGLAGTSTVEATSVEQVFALFPALQAARSKLVVRGDEITGYAPCDG